jgi:hypothetical protein
MHKDPPWRFGTHFTERLPPYGIFSCALSFRPASIFKSTFLNQKNIDFNLQIPAATKPRPGFSGCRPKMKKAPTRLTSALIRRLAASAGGTPPLSPFFNRRTGKKRQASKTLMARA